MFAPNFIFKEPLFLSLFLIFPLLIWQYFRSFHSGKPVMLITSSANFSISKPSLRLRMIHLPFYLRLMALACVIIALAHPKRSLRAEEIRTEGIDIMLALDISGSMMAKDFKPNRLEAAKRALIKFVELRPDDRIGLVFFASESFTQCPLTSGHGILAEMLVKAEAGLIKDGTAIGDGICTCVDRLRNSGEKGRAILLLTDGVNNSGMVDPLTASGIASAFNVRVYCIGMGSDETVKKTFESKGFESPYQLDEGLLQTIAMKTGATYFRAGNQKALDKVCSEIDKLEKSRILVAGYSPWADIYMPFVLSAVVLLLLETILRFTYLKMYP